MNSVKNICEFLTDHEDFKQMFTDEYGYDETYRLFAEHIFNLIAECDVEEQLASMIADKLAEVFF